MKSFAFCSLALGCALVAATLAIPVSAQEAAPTGGVIDFKPILGELGLAFAAAASAAGVYLLKLARDWFKAKTGVELQVSDQYMRDALDKAINYAIAAVMGAIGDRAQIRVSNAQLAQIANYVIAAMPDALKNFGITPERLQEMIRARINAWTTGPAANLEAPSTAAPATAPSTT